jgi:hypothetical protein
MGLEVYFWESGEPNAAKLNPNSWYPFLAKQVFVGGLVYEISPS